MMERLPIDLWIEIFIRLPVKIILSFLTVCKSWQLLFQQPSFINSHLQQQRRDLLLVRSIPLEKITLAEKAKPECYSLHCDDESFTFYAKHEFPIQHPTREHYRVVGVCNGVICITNDEFRISHQTYLWNPTIRKCVELPCPKFTLKNIGPFDHELGFGFDEKTNDYKVVRIVQKDDCEDPLEVEIYSLSSGIWRKASHRAVGLGVQIFKRYGSGRNYQAFLNGAVHWVVKDPVQSRCMVISFHLSDEVFRCFEPPLDIEHDALSMINLRPIESQGSLALILRSIKKCSIWMMKEYGDSTSWVKHLDVNLAKHVDRVIGLRQKGELLIEIQGSLYSYKPTEWKEPTYLDEAGLQGHAETMNSVNLCVRDYEPESSLKNLGIRSKTNGNFRYSFYGESYTESLVLIGRINSAEVAKLRAKESEMTRKGNK